MYLIFLSITSFLLTIRILNFQETNANSSKNDSFGEETNVVPINEEQRFQNENMISRDSMNSERTIYIGTTKVLFN